MLLGKFRVERVIGQGGMGLVVAATHLGLQMQVAIKVLLPDLAQDAEVRERFLREARAAAALRSEHVTRVLDVGELPDGAPFLVMEYLEGENLRELLRLRGPLPVAEAVSYLSQACEGLAEAHARGIIHRDVKSSNFILTLGPNGTPLVKVVDFGLSKIQGLQKAASGAPSHPELTATSVFAGSPQYAAPEQLRSLRKADERSDIWGLGVVLYELLAGHRPFDANNNIMAILASVIGDPHRPLVEVRPDVPAGLSDIVSRCLEKEPKNRFPSVKALAAALLPFAAPARSETNPPTQAWKTTVPLGRSVRPLDIGSGKPVTVEAGILGRPSNRWLWLGFSVFVLLVGAIGAVFLLRSRPSPALSARADEAPTAALPTAFAASTAPFLTASVEAPEPSAAPVSSANPPASAATTAATPKRPTPAAPPKTATQAPPKAASPNGDPADRF